jgi:hypothetical protein
MTQNARNGIKARFVAQISNLLYRRFPIGKAPLARLSQPTGKSDFFSALTGQIPNNSENFSQKSALVQTYPLPPGRPVR